MELLDDPSHLIGRERWCHVLGVEVLDGGLPALLVGQTGVDPEVEERVVPTAFREAFFTEVLETGRTIWKDAVILDQIRFDIEKEIDPKFRTLGILQKLRKAE